MPWSGIDILREANAAGPGKLQGEMPGEMEVPDS